MLRITNPSDLAANESMFIVREFFNHRRYKNENDCVSTCFAFDGSSDESDAAQAMVLERLETLFYGMATGEIRRFEIEAVLQ